MGYYSYSANVIIHKNYSPDSTREISRSGQQYVAQGSTFYVYVPLDNSESFTRSGYDFVGYGYNSDPSSLSYYPGNSITFMFNGGGTQNVHIYCVWKTKTYAISYNVGGGSGAPADQSKTHGTNLTLSSAVPTWAGHTFSSWNTAADGTGTSFSPGDTFTIDADTVLYAIWVADTFSVTFNANGGSGAPAAQTKTYGETLALSSTVPTRTNYDFVEWNTASDGTGTSYQPGGEYSANAALALYAIWVATVYTVTYDANGHGTAPSAQTKDPGDTVTVAAAISATGCSFVEWNTAADGAGTTYDPGDTYSADENVTLYAIWLVGVFTLTFNADGGTVTPASKQVVFSRPYGTLPTPTKTGETFYGWFIGDLLITANSIVDLDADATAKAAWSIRSQMRVKGSDNSLHTGALYVKGSDGNMHMAIAYVKGSDGQMHING